MRGMVEINAHTVKSILSHRVSSADGETMPMASRKPKNLPEDPFIAGLRTFFERHTDIHEATVSTKAGLNKSAIRKMLAGEVMSPRNVTMHRIADALGLTVDQIKQQSFDSAHGRRPPSVPVLARVGAGAEIRPIADFASGDGLYHVERPPLLAGRDVAAVEVAGDSMIPLAPDGAVLFYQRSTYGVSAEALNQLCICEDEDGRAWVKVVEPSREKAGRFNLISLKEGIPPRPQVALRWAAPVLLTLRPEFVTRLEP